MMRSSRLSPPDPTGAMPRIACAGFMAAARRAGTQAAAIDASSPITTPAATVVARTSVTRLGMPSSPV